MAQTDKSPYILVSSTVYRYVLPPIVSVQKKPNPRALRADKNAERLG
jgi:hypothetical protein